MTTTTKTRRPRGPRPDIMAENLARVQALLDRGVAFWRKPWRGGGPVNGATGREYRGANVFNLLVSRMYGGFSSDIWLTYRQAQGLGGNVKSRANGGASVARVIKYGTWAREVETGNGETETRQGRYLQSFAVHNLDQCEGVTLPDAVAARLQPVAVGADQVHAAAESILANYLARANAPKFEERGARAFYSPTLDGIAVPPRGNFDSLAEFYSTAFHECGHSTGHHSRLARDGVTNHGRFGDHAYSCEELIAEMTATYLCSLAGVETTESFENSAAYLQSWGRALQANPRWLIDAAAQAQRAADLVRGVNYTHDADQAADQDAA